jgi:hypothetical protein
VLGVPHFRFDDEQLALVRSLLVKADVSLVEPFGEFIARLESSINLFLAATPEGTLRQNHDALRELWRLSHRADPSPALLRVRLSLLPPGALEHLERRARRNVPRLFPGETVEGGFIGWARRAPPGKLVTALRVCSADGAAWVKGRGRGGGKRSGPRIEPQVLGVLRGAPQSKPRSGRPSGEMRQVLVRNLALDWLHGTEAEPELGRSDKTGFGDLVHSIFGWLYEPKAGTTAMIAVAIEKATEMAAYALRGYSAEVRRAKLQPSTSVTRS